MWISKAVWQQQWFQQAAQEVKLRTELAEARAEARAQQDAVKTLAVNLDWLRVRVNQLEHERAVLLENYLGVKVAVPKLVTPEENVPFNDPSAFNPFEDVGDEQAAKLGIGFNLDGTVAYRE